ncbi:hypothetical protein [Caballeronia sp. LZ001]|uniref:hypothetical protein n=1 Tax=Caballeronia sp. LZ001 TaxID=3038553 RepID=UPI00285BB928|nr:hypothetical protein [Caballeronia sp. LZ001]MDR5803648.1 hypothetical protein [Caballeronia sp. LZ001]
MPHQCLRGFGATNAFVAITTEERGECEYEPTYLRTFAALAQERKRFSLDAPYLEFVALRRDHHIDQIA